MDLEGLLSEAERSAVAAAIRAAEGRTSGEIVPYLVASCDEYDATRYKGAALGALAASLAIGLVHTLGGFWGGVGWWWITLPTAGGAALGFLATAAVAPLRRWLVPAEILDLRARRRAMAAFLEEEVFRTRERTGILLFLALFEHRVVVLGDSGINAKVAPGEWQGIVAHLTAAIRERRVAQGLVAAIGECGALLERHGVAVRADDTDELSNRLRLEER